MTSTRRSRAIGLSRRAARECLLDTGPLVALFNARDRHHERAVEFFKSLGPGLRCHSTWEVVGEVMVMLDDSARAQGRFLGWLHGAHASGLIHLAALSPEDLPAVARLVAKYADLPMDWADASLVWLASQHKLTEIATVDVSDFAIYRTLKGKAFRNVFTVD